MPGLGQCVEQCNPTITSCWHRYVQISTVLGFSYARARTVCRAMQSNNARISSFVPYGIRLIDDFFPLSLSLPLSNLCSPHNALHLLLDFASVWL